MLLDLPTLTELYPAAGERRQFLARALVLLREDRLALQNALARHTYARAGELAHRLQGSAAFLTGQPEQAAAILLPLEQAIKRRLPSETQDAQAAALDQLMALESAVETAIGAD